MILVVVILLLIALASVEWFTPAWVYDPRVPPVEAELARVASGAISCVRGGGTGSRDFSRAAPVEPTVVVPYFLADPTDTVTFEPMCSGADMLCTCQNSRASSIST